MDDAECYRIVQDASQRINAAYDRIRQARLDAGIAPGEPMLWPDGIPYPKVTASDV